MTLVLELVHTCWIGSCGTAWSSAARAASPAAHSLDSRPSASRPRRRLRCPNCGRLTRVRGVGARFAVRLGLRGARAAHPVTSHRAPPPRHASPRRLRNASRPDRQRAARRVGQVPPRRERGELEPVSLDGRLGHHSWAKRAVDDFLAEGLHLVRHVQLVAAQSLAVDVEADEIASFVPTDGEGSSSATAGCGSGR